MTARKYEEFVESVLAASEQRIKELDEKADKAVASPLRTAG